MRQVPSCVIIAVTSSATEKRSFIQQRRNTFTKKHDCNRLHIFFGGGNIGPEPYTSPAADAARWTNSDGGMTYEIALYPRHDQVRQAIDFGIGELPALGKMVPFGDAPAAARGGGMLRGKHRMPAPRRLAPVVARIRRPDAGAQQLAGMAIDHGLALRPRIRAVLRRQLEFRTE